MKEITVGELQEKAIEYLTGKEHLAIKDEGEIIGHYYPRKRTKQEESDRLFSRLNKTLDKIAEQSNMTRDELVDALDPSKPFPFST